MIRYDKSEKFTILYHENVNCDAFDCRKQFSKLIRETGKKSKYKKAHEWCCGHGAIGFQLLADDICEHLTLTDIFPLAIFDCQYTIALNDLHNQVSTYRIDWLSDIPSHEKWDLFVTNPPWRCERTLELKNWTSDDDRKMVDLDWKIHINLWNHLSKFLTDDADVYIYEDRRFSNEKTWKKYWKKNKLYLHDVYDNFGILSTGYVMHLKKSYNYEKFSHKS